MIRNLVRFGDDRLVGSNREVDPASEDVAALVDDLIQTCHAAPGVGLAAPQIGVNVRAAVIDLSVGADPGAMVVLINPVILESSGEQREEEGCLSIPDVAAKVARPARVRVRAADASGQTREIEATGLLARALSHEIDHLDGVLFVDRLRGIKRDLTWRRIAKRRERGLW